MSDVPVETDVVSEPEPLPPTTNQLDSLEADRESQTGVDAVGEPVQPPHIVHRETTWHTVSELPGAVSLNLARLKDKSIPDGQKATIVNNTIRFCVVEDERADFLEWLMEETPPIDMNELMDILKKLVESVFNRPTE